MVEWSETWTYLDGEWLEGNPQIIGPRDHAAWLGTTVFDGARSFEGVTPDLDLHCQRVNKSALALGLKPTMDSDVIYSLAKEGVAKFSSDTALYIRPMYWAVDGLANAVAADPESTRFCLCIYDTPMPDLPTGFSLNVSSFRRPTLECMPVNAKAGCLYPNNARALTKARDEGFDNTLLLDMLGNVAELATANIFMVKDGVIFTPAANGTFLSGITRRRSIILMKESGLDVVETTLSVSDFEEADEIFSTGNYSKVMPINKFKDRELQPGPVAAKAKKLYWDWAHA